MSPGAPSIAWINRGGPDGRWGAPGALALPADARGLLLAEGVFETVLVQGGRPRLLAAHLERWHQGATLLGLPAPPGRALIAPLAGEAISRSGIDSGALRLNWCRGSSARGLEPIAPDAPDGALCWLQLSSAEPRFAPVRVIVSATEMRQAKSLLSRCKTFAYGSALIARRQAREAGADDALLTSSAGGLCCASSANLLIRLDGRWLTPPVASGCLPGIMRQRALDLGVAIEAAISTKALRRSDGALLLNSLGCRPIHGLCRSDGQEPATLVAIGATEAERFWRRLLESDGASDGAQKQPWVEMR
jgi:branched-subunit amino acid aminotransferase/4-amino-4-deoxychorismate lyase